MSQLCVTDGCKYTSRVLCHCCNKDFCLEHLKQHDETINSQINPLVDEINTLSANLITLNTEELISNCREKLDQWRDDCILMINQFYDKKCQELNRRCHKRLDLFQVEMNEIRSKMTKLINEKEITSDDLEILSLNIYDIKKKVEQIKKKSFEINFYPLKLDENLISIEEPKIYQLDLSKLSTPFRKLNCTDQSWPTMISNDHFFLVDQYPNIILFNKDLKIVKQVPWSYGSIRDMCWSSVLTSFIIINNEKEVFLVKENSLSIQCVQTIGEQSWYSCTCSDRYLFLTNTNMGTNIFQFNILSSFHLIKQWKPPDSCKYQEYIDDINYNNGTLALIIKVSSNNTVHLELRSSTTLDRLWKLQLDVKKSWFQQTIRCCSIMYDEWLVVEGNTSHLFHILKNGKLKIMGEYKPSPVNAMLFGSNILAIRTKENIMFHRL
jgi:hypothetical protein